ncbi:MAG TPA: PAS domain-containing protein [Planctomycetota bacterium]|nr:PAS domain-containing protein [Planctomycetota bacterium]
MGPENHVREGQAVDQPPTDPSSPATLSAETKERLAADRRGRTVRQNRNAPRPVPPGRDDPQLINTAVAALCEAVRDYAIFVMNADGVIIYWGMGAHLMKWWTDDEAEGGHLRMLYPVGGSEDGTAEAHLIEAAETGEYVGEGQRVRRGGSTFWAHVTLTALRDPQGKLLGFAKVTQDLTKRRAVEAAVALANEAETTREAAMATTQVAQVARERADEACRRAEAARERAEEAAAIARDQARGAQEHITNVLEPALAAEQARRAALGVELDAYVQTFTHHEREETNGPPSSA